MKFFKGSKGKAATKKPYVEENPLFMGSLPGEEYSGPRERSPSEGLSTIEEVDESEYDDMSYQSDGDDSDSGKSASDYSNSDKSKGHGGKRRLTRLSDMASFIHKKLNAIKSKSKNLSIKDDDSNNSTGNESPTNNTKKNKP